MSTAEWGRVQPPRCGGEHIYPTLTALDISPHGLAFLNAWPCVRGGHHAPPGSGAAYIAPQQRLSQVRNDRVRRQFANFDLLQPGQRMVVAHHAGHGMRGPYSARARPRPGPAMAAPGCADYSCALHQGNREPGRRQGTGGAQAQCHRHQCPRGGIVDEAALYDALTPGHFFGAGLDVWKEREPPAPEHPLLTLANVMATPHAAGGTVETQNAVHCASPRNC